MRRGPGTWRHLAGRLLETMAARDVDPAEAPELGGLLRPGEEALYWAQDPPDRRHALTALRVVAAAAADRADLQRAALLHDVGKRHARIGPIHRSVASALMKLGFPVRGRYALYRDHGGLGADELAELGAEPLVVQFARHHHGERPPGIPVTDWELLQRADGEGR